MASLLSLSLKKPSLLTTKATTLTSSTTTTTTAATPSPPDTLSLDQKFGRKGIKFSDSNDSSSPPSVELSIRNGSTVKLQISNAHVTSYKPKVFWKDDGFEELLFTTPPSPTTNASKGGIGLVFNKVSDDPKVKPSPVDLSQWVVKDSDSDAIDAVQVELSCISSGTLDISYIVSLYPVSLGTALIVKNKGQKAVSLTNAILSHLRFIKRGRCAIDGLRCSSFCVLPPLSSPFELLSPAEAMKTEELGWLSSFGWDPENKPGTWSVQEEPVVILRHKMSRVYASPPEDRLKGFCNSIPTKYETIDTAKELWHRVVRLGGFEDIYLSTPGSMAEKYGKEYFICTGPASMLVPITINPGEEWRGAQVIEHDNL